MCIAILNKKGLLSKETVNTCYKNNPDGMGLMWTEKGKLKTHKQLKHPKSFYNVYKQVRSKNPKAEIVLHFRIGTSGKVDLTNCHPFYVHENLGFVHNGVISIDTSHAPHLNDTNVFNNTILKHLPKDFTKSAHLRHLVERYIGSGSKLIFLDYANRSTIINEEAGHWDENKENWYSNHTYTCSTTRFSGYYNERDWGLYGGYGYYSKHETSHITQTEKKYNKVWDSKEGRFVDAKKKEDVRLFESFQSKFDKELDKELSQKECLGHCYNCNANLFTEDEAWDMICTACAFEIYGEAGLPSRNYQRLKKSYFLD